MQVRNSITIRANHDLVWKTITDIENAAQVFKDIKNIEVIEKPPSGILGFKWKEVREFMGKEATETMWISEVEEGVYYIAEAQNSGCLYQTTLDLRVQGDEVVVTKTFKSTPLSFFAKLMAPMMKMMKGSLLKCLTKDLEDLKSHLS